MARKERDPYAPPPMHHDHSGAVLRVAVIALLLGGAVWGYTIYADQPQRSLVAETAPEQQMAEAGAAAPQTLPEATSESLPQAAPAAPAPQPRRTTRAAEPPADPVPPPSTSSAPTTPAPVPPVDVPPAG